MKLSFLKNISEFIFFDGENIKKYVEILNNDGQSGDENRRIKIAINNILGTPYLDRLINRLELIRSNYITEHTKKVSQNTKDETLRKDILDLQDRKDKNDKALKEAKISLDAESTKYKAMLERLQNISKSVEIYSDLVKEEGEKKTEEGHLSNFNLELSALIQSSLKSLLFDKIYAKKQLVEKENREFEEKDKEYSSRTQRSKELQKLVVDNICSLCGNHLSNEKLSKIQKEISEIESNAKNL